MLIRLDQMVYPRIERNKGGRIAEIYVRVDDFVFSFRVGKNGRLAKEPSVKANLFSGVFEGYSRIDADKGWRQAYAIFKKEDSLIGTTPN